MNDDILPADWGRVFLGKAARTLAASTTFDDALERTLRAALPELGDYGVFDAVDGEQVRRVAAAHGDPQAQALLAATPWAPRAPAGPNVCALCSGQASLHAGIDDAWRERVARSPAELALLQQLDFVSLISVPVRRGGQLVGALTLYMGRSRRSHGEEHLHLAEDLAAMAAPTVVNARLAAAYEQSQAALAASEGRLRLATEAGDLGIWDWDIAADRVIWSDAVYRLHGVEPGQFGGRVGDFAALVHPEDLAAVQQRLERALAGEGPYEAEFRAVRPDGRVRWLTTRAKLLRDAAGKPLRMVGATQDITERVALLAAERDARAQAERARQRLELLAMTSARLTGSLEPDATLRAIAGILVPALADWCRIDLLAPDGRLERALTYHADAARTAEADELAQRLRAADDTVGSMGWCLRSGVSHYENAERPEDFAARGDADLLAFALAIGMRGYCVTPLVARGRKLGVLAVLQAESGRRFGDDDAALIDLLAKRAALALDNARLYSEAEGARRQAEQASRAKDEFLAMLGHELRNPLAPIVTTLELMRMQDPEVFARERALIERQVDNLSRLVDDLLDVARIARGDVQLRREHVDLRDVLARAVETASPLIERKRHELRLELPPAALPCHADAARLVQVFANLIANAARYTGEGGHIAVRAETAAGDTCRVTVADDGEGIAPEVLPKVFELFFQDHRQGSDHATRSGLGVGLALVKNLVGLHGGSVSAASPGRGLGSVFAVTLPLAEPPAGAAKAVPTGAGAQGQAKRALARRVLIVDDNRDALDSLTALVELEGHEVRPAADAVQALRVADSFAADVAILDLGLPDMDGYELAARLRERPAFAGCRMIALSGYGLAHDLERSRRAGFAAHWVKPVAPDVLLQALQQS